MFASKFTSTVAAAAAFLLLTPGLVNAIACTRNYTVVPGDICDGISRAHNVSSYQLAALNIDKIDALCEHMQIGESLCLGTEGEDCNQVHVVSPGDTCDKIVTTYGLNSTVLFQNNPNIDGDCDGIYNGLVLCVSKTVQAPPVPSGFFTGANIEWVPTPENEITEADGYVPDCDEVVEEGDN
ncbi:hypothetical protein FRC14_007289 [Serendipita sp. 396]|nr:hypothetical protein FRC14_007289 [Serendipita sp. 396]KAG8787981.1 hypothetical protein FRC15_006792 [Serendipita sp. 397]KAG8799520.1 hypothetical protein FRC16_004942 [Serendipita sp. 398]KAG8813569.1 hypothetical protein FRC19_002344 [Serendipita sp. 401]KAG8834496.1 hypothetical protein FRC18_001957 [Serendipita sp. 400]KAG8848890.1 hypothetical protein FRB91_010426 [Serendipita sp. 411]KAG8867641.1 hypothetical protein FRC20_005266 [Serendipita sp. 405]KAG9044666.1 hypothetical prot